MLNVKKITLTAEAEIIQKAIEKAKKNGLTVNEIFQSWLHQYVAKIDEYDVLMNKLKYVSPGKKFTRDELNER